MRNTCCVRGVPRPRWLHRTTLAAGLLMAAWSAACHGGDWDHVKSWVYQLTNYQGGKLDEIAGGGFDLAVVDLARDGASDFFTRDEIEQVQKRGTMILAYLEIGAIENYRPEWKNVPDDLKAGAVGGWPKEQYVKFWDDRWWPVVRGRLDQALKAGFNGAYLDLVTSYEEIPVKDLTREELAHKMVDLISRISQYAKGKQPDFRIVPQNSPELYTWSFWEPKPNQKYLDAIDGLGMEDVFYLAHDKPADKPWCKVNRDNALAIRKAGKLVLAIDYCTTPERAADAYAKERAIGFVPYVSVRNLDVVLREGQTKPKRSKPAKSREP